MIAMYSILTRAGAAAAGAAVAVVVTAPPAGGSAVAALLAGAAAGEPPAWQAIKAKRRTAQLAQERRKGMAASSKRLALTPAILRRCAGVGKSRIAARAVPRIAASNRCRAAQLRPPSTKKKRRGPSPSPLDAGSAGRSADLAIAAHALEAARAVNWLVAAWLERHMSRLAALRA